MSKYDFDYNMRQLAHAQKWFGKALAYSREYRYQASKLRQAKHLDALVLGHSDYHWNIEQAVFWRKQAVEWLKISKLHSARLCELHEGAYYDGMATVA